MIRKELENPFADPRYPYQPPLPEELFYLLTEENRFDFLPGCNVLAHILESQYKNTVTLIVPPSGVIANALDVQNYMTEDHNRKSNSAKNGYLHRHSLPGALAPGTVVSCRIESIHFSDFIISVFLSDHHSADLLATVLPLQNPGLVSSHFTSKRIYQILQLAAKRTTTSQINSQLYDSSGKSLRIVVRRRIDHPRFRMTVPSRAIRELRNGTVGDTLITPNEASLKELVVTTKVCNEPYLVKTVLVQEFDQPNPGELGKTLKIASTVYTSLDSIFAQYVEGLRVNLAEMYAFEKYYSSSSLDGVEHSLIAAQKKKASQTGQVTIEWGITIDTSYPAKKPGVRFYLISLLPSKTALHSSGKPVIFRDGIYVTSEGFRLWDYKERSLGRLVNWWKTQGYFQRCKHIAKYNQTKKSLMTTQPKNQDVQQKTCRTQNRYTPSHHSTC